VPLLSVMPGVVNYRVSSARNIALSEQQHPKQDIVATCAACWLATREASERIAQSTKIKEGTGLALKEAGLEMKNDKNIRHMVEVLVEDIGMQAISDKVKKPLEGIKIAGYVGLSDQSPLVLMVSHLKNPAYWIIWSKPVALSHPHL